VGSERVGGRPLDELEVAEGREFQGDILKGLACLVDDEDIEEDVVLVHVDVGLGIDSVRMTGQLNYAVQLGDGIVSLVATSGTLQVGLNLIVALVNVLLGLEVTEHNELLWCVDFFDRFVLHG